MTDALFGYLDGETKLLWMTWHMIKDKEDLQFWILEHQALFNLTKQQHQPSSNCNVTKHFLLDLLNTHKWPCSRFDHAVPQSITTEENSDII
ncbi:hypothetical protein DD577_29070, partial [Klebsiella pneumoniae]|uniref:hypothetical protein n=1 Tax=Klebsiella pneumoniae TaxID=573 RepID=UPI001026B59F